MRIWLLSHLKNSPGNKIFLEAARRRGHLVESVDALTVDCRLAPPAEFPGQPDLVFARMGSSAPPHCLHLVAALEAAGARCVNRVDGLWRSRDKARAYLELSRAEVRVPATFQPGPDCDPAAAAAELGAPPWIVKLPLGTQGNGVMLAESIASLRALMKSLHALGQAPLLQQFVGEARGSDIRVLVVGGRAVVAVRRQAREGEFRSNLHLGGRPLPQRLSPEMASLAEAATAALGLEVAGVDLLESAAGLMVLEVNSSPGLTASPELVERLIDYLER